MSYRIIYNDSYKRVIPAVLIDSRASIPAIVTAGGYDVLDYTNSQTALIVSNVVPYKIETDLGNLVGYFNLTIGTNPVSASLLNKQLRPAFQKYDSDITQLISNFIISSDWVNDYLF